MIVNVSQIFFIFALIVLTKGEETKVNSCTGNVVFPKVFLHSKNSACKETPCKVTPGSTLQMDLNFTSPGYLEHIKPNARAFVMGGQLDYPLTQTDACSGITNTICPLVLDEPITYTIALTLPSVLPSISLGLEFTLIDNDINEAVVCFKIDLIVDS